jgi:hypothetical protein
MLIVVGVFVDRLDTQFRDRIIALAINDTPSDYNSHCFSSL